MKRLIPVIVLLNSALAAFALDLSEFTVKGFEGKGQLEFNTPEDLILSEDGRIIVADQKNNRLQILTREGDFIRFIPQMQTVQENADPAVKEAAKVNFDKLVSLMKKPTGLAFDKAKRLYVSCMDSDIILILDFESGTLLGTIGKSGKSQGDLKSPMDIDIAADGRIAVAEWQNQRVQILDQQGKCIKEIVYNEQTKKGGFKAIQPRGVFWTAEGKLLVSYPLFNQVVCWNVESGELEWRYGVKGRDRGMLNNPSFINYTPEGRVLISDSQNNRIVEITRDGKYYLNYPIRKGSAPGRLISPRGLMVNNDETLVVADQGNNRVHFFQPGQATLMLREVKELALKDDWGSAMPKIERILYLKPNDEQARELMVNALYYFGDRSFSEGDFLKSEEYFRRILRYRPDDPNVPQKLDAIFWASNQGLIASVVFGIIAVIIALIMIWIFKNILSRFVFRRT